MTNHRPDHVTAGPNDYYSEGPYWWPDRKNPNGPYIRKDGERNPGRFMGNRSDLGDMCTAVLTLGMGANLLADKHCAEHAAKVLAVWFVDPKTRMNPNLEFGQAVRGIDTGRGTGIIQVPTEVEADGSCPREEARTNSLSYSTMNLDGFSVLCRIARTNGVNLWRCAPANALPPRRGGWGRRCRRGSLGGRLRRGTRIRAPRIAPISSSTP